MANPTAPLPDQEHALKQAGVAQYDLDKLKAMPNVNWVALVALIAKYGPAIATDLLAIFA